MSGIMHLSEIMNPDMVWANLESGDKDQVILELARNISGKLSALKADDIADVLMKRESLGSTGIEDGIAIPHAKVKGLKNFVVACGRSVRGINFEAPDQKPTHLFFVLLVPEQSAALHLKVLARLSRLLKDDKFRSRLLGAGEAKDIYKMIIEEDSRK